MGNKLREIFTNHYALVAVSLLGFISASCSAGWLPGTGRQQQNMNRAAINGYESATPSARVRQAQSMLKELNYNPGQVDGVLGPETRGAIRDFQYEQGMQITGILGEQTFDRLQAESQRVSRSRAARAKSSVATNRMTKSTTTEQTVKEPAQHRPGINKLSSEKIKQVQKKLNSEGFDAGHVDGLMGPQTRAAIENFQREKNINVSGKLDDKTLQELGIEAPSNEMSQKTGTSESAAMSNESQNESNKESNMEEGQNAGQAK